jgi:hypothetical protein
MNPKKVSPENQMMQIILGKWISKPVHVATKLGIPDMIGEGSMHIENLYFEYYLTSVNMLQLFRKFN